MQQSHCKNYKGIFTPSYFEDKQFLISGASSGIGAYIALYLNALGAKILALGRDMIKLEKKQQEATHKDRFIPITKDIAQVEGLDKWALNLAREYGSFSGAVLSAGTQQTAPITSVLSVENARDVFATNYFGNLALLKGLLDKRAKSEQGASFVWISSNASIKAQKGLTSYAASKSAINTAIKSIALEIAPTYRINAVSPGFVHTEMIDSWSSIYDKHYIESIDKAYPLGIGKVEYIAPLVGFLLSAESSWITGQNIVIDGGGSL